ncbi:MAG: putative sporulation protein YtxC [Clostridia bacterium]|jgi:putative sporulation protein YtxC|nr:putative sporulation protein YtxC [Clostridia bacterium]
MKSFCFKTNNTQVLNYLLNRIQEIDFENLIYSQNQFKIYKNITIHYRGNNNNKFYNFLTELIGEVVIEFYEEKILKQLINYNYFYFDEYEKNKILENCMQLIEPEMYNTKLLDNKNIKEYVKENKAMILDGFVYFRLRAYLEYLDEVVDSGVNQFVIEKEYREFISLLRVYVESKVPEYNLLHLIYINGESILLDEKRNIVSVSENIYNAKYLSDISFSSNDFALNTLLCLLPRRVEIHLIDDEDEFINTLKLIFEGRVTICKDCDICKTYKILNNAKISHNK